MAGRWLGHFRPFRKDAMAGGCHRRIRLLFLDAKAAEAAAPAVAAFMATRLGWSEERQKAELDNFVKLTKQYRLVA